MTRRTLSITGVIGLFACADVAAPPARVETAPAANALPGVVFTIMEDLGTLPGGVNSSAAGINASRQVTGWSEIGEGPGITRAFLWTPPGPMLDLGPLPGGGSTRATDVNNAAQVAGWGSGLGWDAFLWEAPGPAVTLGSLSGIDQFAYGINNSGWIVGSAEDPAAKPFVWVPPGPMVGIGDLGGGTGFAASVNDLGEVVGASPTAAGFYRAFHWTNDDGMTELQTLATGDTAGASDIGNGGTVVGWATNQAGDRRAVQWTSPGAEPEDLGTLGGSASAARGVNAAGTIVGGAETAGGDVHAFRRAAGGTLFDLGTLGGPESTAEAVNGAGHAVGWADLAAEERHAVAWWTYVYNDALQCDCEFPDRPVDPRVPGGFKVVILGTRELAVSRVDVNTLSLGDGIGRDTRVAIHRGHLAVRRADENGDGLEDLAVWFDEQTLLDHGDLTPESEALILLGALTDRSNGLWGTTDVEVIR